MILPSSVGIGNRGARGAGLVVVLRHAERPIVFHGVAWVDVFGEMEAVAEPGFSYWVCEAMIVFLLNYVI